PEDVAEYFIDVRRNIRASESDPFAPVGEWIRIASSPDDPIFDYRATFAGYFEVRGGVRSEGETTEIYTQTGLIEIQFPDQATILDEVLHHIGQAWQDTENFVRSNPGFVQEFGFWIVLDTRSASSTIDVSAD